jgi:hypothetical protein
MPGLSHMRQEQASPKAKHLLLAAVEDQDAAPPLPGGRCLDCRVCVWVRTLRRGGPLNLSVAESRPWPEAATPTGYRRPGVCG